MPELKNFNIQLSLATMVKIAVFGLALYFLFSVRDTLMLILISIIFALAIEPIVDWFEKQKIPRGMAVLIIYILVGSLIFILVELLIPPIAEQASLLIENLPSIWDRIVENFSTLTAYSQQQGFSDNIQQGLAGLQSSLQTAATGVYNFLISVVWSIIDLIVVLVLVFYFAVYPKYAENTLMAILPGRYHADLYVLVGIVKKKIGDWARGQLILCLIIGLLSFCGLIFLLPRYALLLAVIAGLTEFVPYLGPIIGAIPALLLAMAVGKNSFWVVLGVLALYVIIQELENNVIVPQVMKKTVGLHPITVILVMLIAAEIAGIIGLLLVIPITGALFVCYRYFVKKEPIKTIAQSESTEKFNKIY